MQLSITTLAAFVVSSTALGINCRGSGLCGLNTVAGNLINLKSIVDDIRDRNTTYATGHQIACNGQLCAFFQNGATGTAEQTSAYLQQLLDHGCTRCGSVPTQPGNNVDSGELTANMVSDPKCQGAC